MLWFSIPKQQGHTKINEQLMKTLYIWNILHPQIVQYPIDNDFLKAPIDGHSEPQLLPKWSLQVSAQELYNSMVILP